MAETHIRGAGPLVIRKYPDAVLRKTCSEIKDITDHEKELFDKMLFTMKRFFGIGLAAPQIGISKKLIVVEVEDRTLKLANPKIELAEGAGRMEEGCLSVPDLTVEVERPFKVVVVGLNERGKEVRVNAEGLMARVLQHEIDHLRGKLIIDHAGILKKIGYGIRHKRQ